MFNGSRYWANSRVDLRSGKSLFVEDSDYTIERKLKSKSEFITLTIAGIYSSEINIRKSDISSYGHYCLF